ncbi:DHA2 family efflux MFS transporter permease subunit [Paenibacillus sp. FSL W7-1287]|uniref:DHA2 family efflux MFS transporter permease subunit n=1 Tax=Paenibacillus sp. FSL W7-1287 TaxID=2954538 RepID=UPI0030FB9EC9
MNKWRNGKIMTISCLGLFMAMLDTLIVGVALPQIELLLQTDMVHLEWVMNAYTLMFAVGMIPFSLLAERYGRRNGFVLGLALFTAGSLLAGLSQSILLLIVARGIQGIGAAAILPISLTLIYTAFPEEKRALAVGIWSGISGLGLTIGPLIGGIILDYFTWEMIFLVNVPVGIITVLLCFFWIEESYGIKKRFDIVGLVLLTSGLFGIVYALITGNLLTWSHLSIMIGSIGGAILLIAFLIWESRCSYSLITLKLFRYPSFSVTNFVGFWMSAGIFGSIFVLTLFLQQVQGYSPLEAGVREMLWTTMTMIAAPLAGVFMNKYRVRSILMVGLLLQVIALCSFGLVINQLGPIFSFGYLAPGMIGAGIGMGLCFTGIQHGVLEGIPDAYTGEGSGVSNAIRELGGVFGIAIAGVVFHRNGLVTSGHAFAEALVPTVYVCAGMIGLASISLLYLYVKPLPKKAIHHISGQ